LFCAQKNWCDKNSGVVLLSGERGGFCINLTKGVRKKCVRVKTKKNFALSGPTNQKKLPTQQIKSTEKNNMHVTETS